MLAFAMCALAGVALLIRRDLWPAALWAGIAGGVLEVISEIWYLQDYWAPPTLLASPAPEDFFYGFGTTALTVCIAPILLGKKYVHVGEDRFRWPWTVGGITLFHFLMFIFMSTSAKPHIVSIWSATALFAWLGILACSLREDMERPALLTAAVMGIVAAAGYALGLDVVIDGKQYLNQILLTRGTAWDIRALGNVPLDEIAWNITRAWCVVGAYALLGGRKLVPR